MQPLESPSYFVSLLLNYKYSITFLQSYVIIYLLQKAYQNLKQDIEIIQNEFFVRGDFGKFIS